jgi:thiol oxidase
MAKEIHAKQPKIAFHAVSCVAHHKLCKTQNVDGYPTVMLYKEGSYMAVEEEFDRANADSILEKLGFDSEGKQTSTGKVKSIRVKPPVKRHVTLKPKGATKKSLRNEEVHKEKPKPVESKPAKIARVVPFHTHEVSDAWHDAATSFEFSLKYNIYMSNGHMPRKQQDAFLDWLELLVDVLPPQMNRTLDLIKHLIDNFTRATLGLEIMNELIREKFPPMKEQIWRTCTYEDNDNGYTCGLWQLFHVMSVGLVEHNKHSKSPIPTRYVAETLRNYIENFFQCDVCRMNFLYMYDSCAFDGCHRLSNQASTSEHDWKEFPLWLWETHNDVNVRLMGERLQRDNQEGPSDWEQQQARWPSLYQCPNCWKEDHSWDQDEVFEELHSVYW